MARTFLVVLPAEGGSRTHGEYVVSALVARGHQVHTFDCGAYARGLSSLLAAKGDIANDLLNQSLVAKALEIKADVVLVMALAPVTVFAVTLLKNASIRTVHYFCEDLKMFSLWKPIIKTYDHFFIIQKNPWEKQLQEAYNPETRYLPHGAPIEYLEGTRAPKEYGAVFVGSPYENRVRFFDKLYRMGCNFSLWGHRWAKAPLSPECKTRIVDGVSWLSSAQIQAIFSKAQIVINLHSTIVGDQDVDIKGDFINPRTFMVPLCRALQIADRRDLLYDFYEERTEIVTFSSAYELKDKIEYYLTHEEERERIVEAAFRKTVAAHLLTTRMDSLERLVFPDPSAHCQQAINELAEDISRTHSHREKGYA